MGALPHRCRSRIGLTPLHRTLVILALAANGLIVLGTLVWAPLGLVITLPLAALPAVLFGLESHPRAFRLTAALFGTLYAAIAVLLLFIGGLLFAPSALVLLWAAAFPALATDADARRRRYLLYLGAGLLAFLVLAAILTIHGA